MAFRALTFALFLAVFSMPAAWASDAPSPVPSRQLTGVFKPDPEGVWRTVTQTGGASDCIGDPVTPMCAIDSWFACHLRKQAELCEIAYGKRLEGLDEKPESEWFMSYRVTSMRLAAAKDIGAFPEYAFPEHPVGKGQTGDLLIGVLRQNCQITAGEKLSDQCYYTYETPDIYRLRQFGERWRIVYLHPDLEGVWRTVTETDGASDCIGDPAAPICAIDSWFACRLRRQAKLCEAAYGKRLESLVFEEGTVWGENFINYQIVSMRPAEAKDVSPLKDIAPFPEYATGERQIGDLLIGVLRQNCEIAGWGWSFYECYTYETPDTFTLRRFGEQWLIVHFQPDPEGVWRLITYTGSTSDCIGNPVSPMCVIDSWIACHEREEVKLCEIATGEQYGQMFSGRQVLPGSYMEYRITSVRLAEAKDIGPFPEYGTGERQPGDLLIGIVKRYCKIVGEKKSSDNCITDGMPLVYSLRRVGERWRMIDLHSPKY